LGQYGPVKTNKTNENFQTCINLTITAEGLYQSTQFHIKTIAFNPIQYKYQ
jgi:hypothetical protein